MSTLDDFFGPAYDADEQRCLCLICQEKSSDQDKGHWVANGALWVCVDHINEYQQMKAKEDQKRRRRIAQSGKPSYGDFEGTGHQEGKDHWG